MDEKSQVFYLTVISIGTAFLLALSRQMYKSKCSRIECCGIVIERDTQTEQEIDENPALHQSNDIEEVLKLGDINLGKMKKPESP